MTCRLQHMNSVLRIRASFERYKSHYITPSFITVKDICKLCQNFIFSRIHLLLFTWACIPLYKTIPAESLSLVRRDLFKAYWHPLGSKQPIKMMLRGYRWNITSLTVWDVSHDSQVSPRWWIVIVSRALVFWRLRDSDKFFL